VPAVDGQWPMAFRRLWYDFMTRRRAPDSDGVVSPVIELPDWTAQVHPTSEAIAVARRARESEEAGAATAEAKATRLVQASLALLTITLALGSYQLDFAIRRQWLWLPTILPIGIALLFLSLAAFEALQIDRVGVYYQPNGSELANATGDDALAAVFVAEVRGQILANWTARQKLTDLMQARAWFTRGLALLIIASLVAGVGRAYSRAEVTVPHAPANVTAKGIVGGILVRWQPPMDNGGARIQSYAATAEPGGRSCATRGEACQLHGLRNGHVTTCSLPTRRHSAALHGRRREVLSSSGESPRRPLTYVLRSVGPTSSFPGMRRTRRLTSVSEATPLRWRAAP
jgi:hypothetical protein